MDIMIEISDWTVSTKVSTIDCMMNYVVDNWRIKDEPGSLHDFGYTGLFYITLASYLEHTIRTRITIRISMYLEIQRQAQEFDMLDCIIDGVSLPQVDFGTYNNIVRALSTEYLQKVNRMNRDSLFKVYSELFSTDTDSIIDTSLLEDWKALVVIRNTYAHGADMVSSYDGMLNVALHDTYSDTASGRRLNEQRTDENTPYIPFIGMFTDRVMRHYYGSAQQIVKRLDEATTNPAERIKFDNLGIKPLPDLP